MSCIRLGLLIAWGASFAVAQDGLRILSGTPLPPALVNSNYQLVLAAAGGSPPYTWTLQTGGLPPGLAFANGSISGVAVSPGTYSLTLQVADSTGARVTQASSISAISGPSSSRLGVLSHIAFGGDWSTGVTLMNNAPQPVPFRINFYADSGSPLSLPFVITQQGSTQSVTASTYEGALNPNTALSITTGAAGSTLVGWAEVLGPGPLSGYAIFRSTPASGQASEGIAPLQTQSPAAFALPYDNTAGLTMGVAFANPATSPSDITATIWDDNGAQVDVQTFTIPAKGHTAFVMPTQLPATAGKRGVVRFLSTGTGGIAGVGLRFTPLSTFTSVPTL